jgi:ribonuclease P protein component
MFKKSEDEVFKTTVVVSKSVCALATGRNRAKRQVFSLMLELLPDLKEMSILLVIVVKAALLEASRQDLLAALRQKLSIIQGLKA